MATKKAGNKRKRPGRYGVFVARPHALAGLRSLVIPDTFKTLAAAKGAIDKAIENRRSNSQFCAPRIARRLRGTEK